MKSIASIANLLEARANLMVKSGKFVVSDCVKPGKQIVQLVEELFGIMREFLSRGILFRLNGRL